LSVNFQIQSVEHRVDHRAVVHLIVAGPNPLGLAR
jgi:hypothetical protein